MRRSLALGLLLIPHVALAAPGDPRIVRGVLQWPSTLAREPFVVVRGDNGVDYVADVSTAQRRGERPLTAGARVSVVAVEGGRPYEVTAILIGVGDAAIAGLTPPAEATEAPSASPATASPRPTTGGPGQPGPAPLAPVGPRERWQRVEGTVGSLAGTELVLKTPAGAPMAVDVSRLPARVRRSLAPGDAVTVFVVSRETGLVATGLVQ
jgi:hypothetical protein